MFSLKLRIMKSRYSKFWWHYSYLKLTKSYINVQCLATIYFKLLSTNHSHSIKTQWKNTNISNELHYYIYSNWFDNLESKFLYACLNKRLFTQFVKSHKIMIRYMEKNTYIQEDQVCLTKETLVFYYESMKS